MSKVGRRSPKGDYTPRDHYMQVTDQIIAALEAGTPPWRKPWDPDKAGNPGMPCNAVTCMRYRRHQRRDSGDVSTRFCQRRPALGYLQTGGGSRLAGEEGRSRNESLFFQTNRAVR